MHDAPFRSAAALLLLLLLWIATPLSGAAAAGALADAQRALDSGDAQTAIARIDAALAQSRDKADRGALLLARGTARLMLGQEADGEADLRRALELDPSMRQGWLNLAGLSIARERYADAQMALERAEALEPSADDNDLNLGTVLLLQGEREAAAVRYARYLARHSDNPVAYFTIAGNHALVGSEADAVGHLRRAVALDEQIRLRIRNDRKFALFTSDAYLRLLSTDTYRVPADHRTAAGAFRTPYSRTDRTLINAVLDALRASDVRFQPTVEATDDWALVWTDEMRIKVTNQPNGTGVVRMSAPPEGFAEAAWRQRTDQILRAINAALTPRLGERRPG
ncbi:MAG: hypothetical protein AAF772_04775 [Acidobacteriota bacterium]